MNYVQELGCPNCGAAVPLAAARDFVARCDYCGTTFRLPTSLTAEPEIGDLLLGADFRDPGVPGWKVLNTDKLEFHPGPPPEMRASFPATDLNHAVLRSPGPLDDCDVSMNVRFLEGVYNHMKAGFELRSGDAGDYIIHVSAQATFRVGWHNKTEWGGELVGWTEHPALRKEVGSANRLRVVMRGDLLRVHLNGVLATSLRDARFSFGFVRVVLAPGTEGAMRVAFSDLQLREVKPD